MRTPQIELLWWEGCPSTDRALAELRAALDDVGLDTTEIRQREVETDADAVETGFRGSPTILIDGIDLTMRAASAAAAASADAAAAASADAAAAEPIGLSCRVYRRRDGRISPTPDPDDLRAALRAATRDEVRR